MNSSFPTKLSIFLFFLGALSIIGQDLPKRPIQISANEKLQIKPVSTVICTQEGLAAKESFEVSFQSKVISLEIYYKPKKGVNAQQLLDFFGQKKITPGRVFFGMGASYEKFLSKDSDISAVSINNQKVQKFTALWGSGRSHDIVVYRYMVPNHDLFDEILITFLNVYLGPATSDIPLSNTFVNKRISARDPRYAAYSEIEKWVQSWQYH